MLERLVERRGQSLWTIVHREERRNVLNEVVLCRLREGVAGADWMQP